MTPTGLPSESFEYILRRLSPTPDTYEDARDAIQEAVLRCVERGLHEGDRDLTGLLVTIARDLYLRATAHRHIVEPPLSFFEGLGEDEESGIDYLNLRPMPLGRVRYQTWDRGRVETAVRDFRRHHGYWPEMTDFLFRHELPTFESVKRYVGTGKPRVLEVYMQAVHGSRL